jgi:hypothetical protein
MAERTSTFPRRDAAGRVERYPDLVGTALAGVVIGVVVLLLFDVVIGLFDPGRFGEANGWLALVLPAWLFVEEFRAWNGGPARWVVAGVSAVLALAVGLVVAGLADGFPALAGGALGAFAFALVYSVVWFFGVRWLDRRTG